MGLKNSNLWNQITLKEVKVYETNFKFGKQKDKKDSGS